ncbi:ABC transporter ATP-binding protein [Paenibacillus sp. SYP-B4298]|uniref:ABC transporter ATP-binding protein n=1 Tax=Paenibacillus sp. SYP-B4298 TaxID=2996034 RepID=UPI0022DD153E|nr:ABC transporter ATP-binding protein [Paenibacillus sp. SYP-B4298]
MDTAVAYEITNIVKTYQSGKLIANDDITFRIERGEVFGLLGPNGAGKSTLVRQLAGLSKPTSGSIKLFGHDLVASPKIAGHLLAVQPQSLSLPLQSRAAEIIKITGRIRGLSAQQAAEETQYLLSQFGLEKHANKRLIELSGGLRRLVSIATTLICKRPVLILDEPTNDLDPEVRRVVWKVIRETANSGSTIILVTHNVIEAEQALDRVAIIKNGKVLAIGSPGELKGRVTEHIRIELVFRSHYDYQFIIHRFPQATQIGLHRYNLMVSRSESNDIIQELLPQLQYLDDFRIVTPNLEDIYIELTGGETIEC